MRCIHGHALSTAWGFPVALLSVFLAVALFAPRLSHAQEVKQIRLTEKHVQSFMAASEEMAMLSDGANQDKMDTEFEAQAEALVKKHGFASLAEFDDVLTNISVIMFGIDQQSRQFIEPQERIKQQIAALKSNKSMPERLKKEDLAQLEAALNEARPIQFKENIAVVLKYLDKLQPLLQEQGPAD